MQLPFDGPSLRAIWAFGRTTGGHRHENQRKYGRPWLSWTQLSINAVHTNSLVFSPALCSFVHVAVFVYTGRHSSMSWKMVCSIDSLMRYCQQSLIIQLLLFLQPIFCFSSAPGVLVVVFLRARQPLRH